MPPIFVRMQGRDIGGVPTLGTPLIFTLSVAYKNIGTPPILLPQVIDRWSIYWWRTRYGYATDISNISGAPVLWYATNILEHINKCGQPHLPSHFPSPLLSRPPLSSHPISTISTTNFGCFNQPNLVDLGKSCSHTPSPSPTTLDLDLYRSTHQHTTSVSISTYLRLLI